MSDLVRWTTTALVGVGSLCGYGSRALAEGTDMRLILNVEDYVGLTPSTLSEARNELTLVFVHAGVHVVWSNGSRRPKAKPDNHVHVAARILNRQMAERKLAADGIAEDVIGVAAPAACQISVFHHRLPGLISSRIGEMLGRVLAHELGHLLLVGQGHTDIGIMRSPLDLFPRVPPVFTADQEAMIRSTLSDRALAHCRDVR